MTLFRQERELVISACRMWARALRELCYHLSANEADSLLAHYQQSKVVVCRTDTITALEQSKQQVRGMSDYSRISSNKRINALIAKLTADAKEPTP